MPNYLVANIKALDSVVVDLDEAARIPELDPDDIEWAIEETGRCDVEDWAILPEGATYTPYDPNNSGHNPHGRSEHVGDRQLIGDCLVIPYRTSYRTKIVMFSKSKVIA
jgi:hypothetical protein